MKAVFTTNSTITSFPYAHTNTCFEKKTCHISINPKMEGNTIQHFPSKLLLQKAFFPITCMLLKMAAIFLSTYYSNVYTLLFLLEVCFQNIYS